MTKRVSAVAVAMVGMVLGSCGGAAVGWEGLSASEQRAFRRCQNVITLRQCPPLPGAMNETECVSAARASYASVPEPAERRRWLAAQGCSRTAEMAP